MKRIFNRSNFILLKVLPFVLLLLIVKTILHNYGLEVIHINALFSGIIGAVVFLLGFLMTGVLSDYKESEKIPGEMASIIATIADELEFSYKAKKDIKILESLKQTWMLSESVIKWFYKKEHSKEIRKKLRDVYESISELDGIVLPNYTVRMKAEQSNLRKLIIRAHTIRETNFIHSGYLIGTTATILLLVGLSLTSIEPFYESLFIVGVISYLLIFLIMLIRDLDNPFGFYEAGSSEDIALTPLTVITAEIGELYKELNNK